MKKHYILILIYIIMNNVNAQCVGSYCLGYYPGTPLHLGSGFSIDNPSRPYTTTFLKNYQIDSQNTSGTTNFYCSIISNEASLKKSLNVGGYLSVSDLAFSIDATFGMSSSSFYSSNSVTLALSAITDFGSVFIENPSLDSSAKNYLNINGSPAFIDHFGDHFIVQKQIGVSATLFLTISNLSSAQQNSLTSSISGQVAGLGSAGANFANAINAANQSGNLTIQVAANGAGFADLNDLVTQARANTNAFDSIKNAFSRYMKQFTIAQAQTTSFTYAPMSNFLVKGTNSLPSGKVAKLTEIYDSYYDVIGKAKLLNDILNSQYYLDFHNNSDALEAIRLANQFKSAQNSLIAAYNACKANSCADIFTCCIYPTFNFNSALFDKFLKSPFSNCNNDLWSERYSSKGIFTFTSVADQTFYLNQDFYNCSSSNPILAGKEVQTNFWCNVFNTGYAGGPGYVPGGIMFYVNTSEEQYNSNIGYGAYIAGNCPISGNHISLVGSNGMISAQVLLTAVGADNPYLILRKGAQMKMTIVDPSPPIEAFITPSDATICKGSSITLSANACNDCKYSWSFNSIPTGDTTQSINVSPNISGHYTVSITNSIGSNISYWSNITVTQSPNTPIITGSSTICQGSYNLLTANSLGCTNCSYTWLPNNQIGSSIYTNTPNIYTVKASNGCLPDATSLPKTLTSIQPPSTPSFTINGCSLVLPQINYVKYQWYLNDTAITGATSRFYKVKELGYYSVKITDTIIGCSSFSLDTLLNCTLGVSDKSLSNQFSIYPNPTSGLFTISLEFDKAEISVTNLIGQEIIKINTTQKSTNLQIENNGIYIVTVKTHLGTTNQKLVVNY